MACEMYPWGGFSKSEFDDDWGLKVEKLNANCMNLKIMMGSDNAKSVVKGGCNVLEDLPLDPFGMGIKSTVTTVSGWFEDWKGVGSEFDDCSTDEGEARRSTDPFFSEFHDREDDDDREFLLFGDSGSFILDYSLPENDEELISYAVEQWYNQAEKLPRTGPVVYSNEGDDGLPDNVLPENDGELISYAVASICVFRNQADHSTQIAVPTYSNGEGGSVHDAMFFALGYLGVKDLISVQGVCKSLRDGVTSDSLLWRNICIDTDLSKKINDDKLLQLTSRANGTLRSLSLVGCTRITDSGLERVLEYNPGLTVLSVPDCARLTIDGIVSSLKNFMLMAKPGLKHLRIAGLNGVTKMHIEEIRSILGSENHTKSKLFFHMARRNLASVDDRALDIETCPRCEGSRVVYDCPVQSGRSKNHIAEHCRGCIHCIPRCFMCGGCINECLFTETFCLENLCGDCMQKANSMDNREDSNDLGVRCMIIVQGVHCQFCTLG